MANLLRAFFFKLRRDLTFRITLFIGLGLAVFMTVLFLLIDIGINVLAERSFGDYEWLFCTGQNLMVMSLNPCNNFGLAIPINLITFIVLEFTSGTIRNKIITGNSKSKIYFSLFLTSIIFTLILIISYVGLCTGISSAIGHFNPNGNLLAVSGTGAGTITPDFVWKIIVLGLLAYVVITAATVFFATLIRSIGPCIPIIVILLMGCYISATIVGLLDSVSGIESNVFKAISTIIRYINPLYSLTSYSTEVVEVGGNTVMHTAITNENLFIEVGNNIIYIIGFLLGGWAIFIKRDVK